MAAERGAGQQQSQEMMEGERPLRATGGRRAWAWAGTASCRIGARPPASGHSRESVTAANPVGRGGEARSPGAPARGRQRAGKTRAPGTAWREPAQEKGTDEEAAALGT